MSDDPLAEYTLSPERIAVAGAVLSAGIFAWVGYLIFADALFSALLALSSGVGLYLFLPYYTRWVALTEELGEVPTEEQQSGTSRFTVHHPAAGSGLLVATVVLLSARFVTGSYGWILGVGLAFALVTYLPLSYALPRMHESVRPS